MAGRNKQPLSVIQGKGRSNHLTKKDMKERQEQEDSAKGFTDNISAPSYLTKKQKEQFHEIARELMRLDIFSNLDVDALARYIDSRDEYIKLVRLIRKAKPAEDFKSYSAMQRSKNLLYNECRSSASDLGLSITSRLKLVIPKKEEPEPKTEAEKRFSGRL